MSDSLRLHGLWHTSLPCPSLSPGVSSDSRPLNQWCYLTISSSVIPFMIEYTTPLKKKWRIYVTLPQSILWSIKSLKVDENMEEEMAIHSSIPAWWVEVHGVTKSWTWLSIHTQHCWTVHLKMVQMVKEINSEYSLEGLLLKLKLQYFDHLMWRADSLEKTLMLGKTEGMRRKGDRGWDG